MLKVTSSIILFKKLLLSKNTLMISDVHNNVSYIMF